MSRADQVAADVWLRAFVRANGGRCTRDEALAAWKVTGREEPHLVGAVSRLGLQDPHDPEVYRLVDVTRVTVR